MFLSTRHKRTLWVDDIQGFRYRVVPIVGLISHDHRLPLVFKLEGFRQTLLIDDQYQYNMYTKSTPPPEAVGKGMISNGNQEDEGFRVTALGDNAVCNNSYTPLTVW